MADRRRALCTLAVDRHQELLDITRPTFERYAIRHGYDLVVRTDVSALRGRPASWGKVPLVLELLDRYDVVVWVDVDAVIVDQATDIAAGPSTRPVQLVFHEIDGVVVPNAGVLVLRRGPAAIRLLEQIWHRTEFIDHRWWETAALIEVLGGDGDVGLTTRRSIRQARRRVGLLHPRWNSIPPCSDPDPAIVHLAGVPHEERLVRMSELVASTSWHGGQKVP